MKKTMRMISMLLAVVFAAGVLAMPVSAVSVQPEPEVVVQQTLEEENAITTIRIKATGDLIYGSPFELSVQPNPEDTQYIGLAMGTSGAAKGYVNLILSPKLQTLLKLIPLPKKMSATPEQTEEFNVYSYLKQLIDGNDVSVLLRVADEVVSVMDTVSFYFPQSYLKQIEEISNGMKLALKLIRRYLPEGSFSRIYLDEQPVDAGNYVALAVALSGGDANTAGFAMFKIKPKTENVRLYWAQNDKETMTVEQVRIANKARIVRSQSDETEEPVVLPDVSAVLESDGEVVEGAELEYTYRKGGFKLFSKVYGGTYYDRLPAEPGTYVQTAKAVGNYSCDKIERTIVVVE